MSEAPPLDTLRQVETPEGVALVLNGTTSISEISRTVDLTGRFN